MLSCRTIGTNGRLGNQMFQFAALHGAASKMGYEYVFTPGRLYEVFTMDGVKTCENPEPPSWVFFENKFSYDEHLMNLPPKTEIKGYFQTERYWKHVSDDIVKAFKVRREHTESLPLDLVDFCSKSAFIHVRRTDYLTSNGYHPTFGIEHYSNCVKDFDSIAIFTDDPSWCEALEKSLISAGHETKILSGQGFSDAQEFYLMTKCHDAVISNSSFSWWAAYLGPHQTGRRVVAPRTWFGSNGPSDTQDIYAEGWERA